MFHDLRCSECDHITELFLTKDEGHKIVFCDGCNAEMTRWTHKQHTAINIQGETTPRGCSYNYFDENLGEQVRNKQHRKDLMKQKGLTEYSPDPDMKKHRVEARYIANQANGSDPEAKAAIRREYKTASDTRRNRNLEKSLSDSFEKIGL